MHYRRSRSVSPVDWFNARNFKTHNFGLVPAEGRAQNYPLVHADCNYQLVDVYLSAVLKHTFKSRSEQQAHVSYVFPLPPDSSVHDLTAHIDNRIVKGVVKEKKQARAEYDRAIAMNRQAALLQQENVEVFKFLLGNVRPGQTVTVHISFVSLVPHEGVNDTLRLTFPTSIAPRYGTPPEDGKAASSGPARSSQMTFGLSVQVGANITSISSPSHSITSRLGSSTSEGGEIFDPTAAHISLASATFLQNDIVIIIGCKDLDRQRCVVESCVSEDGKTITDAYALTLVPRFKLPPLPQSEFLFLVDCSGSMSGGKMRAVRAALQIMLKSLPNKGTTFNIVKFGSLQEKLWPQAVPYSAANVQMASGYVNRMSANLGGTEMELGLQAVFSCRTSVTIPTSVFVLTDGECWEIDAVREIVSKHVASSKGTSSFLRVFCMGIGNAVSKGMCEGIVRAGNGYAVYVGEDEDAGRKLINLIRAAYTPPVENLVIDWGIAEAEADEDEDFELIQPYPAAQSLSLFDESHDDSLDLSAELMGPSPSNFWQHPPLGLVPSIQLGSRYSFFAILIREPEQRGQSEKVLLRGTVIGQAINLEVPVVSVCTIARKQGLSDKLIHLIAAREMIHDFEDQGSNEQVLDMALRYGLVSSQTSFVAIDSLRDNAEQEHMAEHRRAPSLSCSDDSRSLARVRYVDEHGRSISPPRLGYRIPEARTVILDRSRSRSPRRHVSQVGTQGLIYVTRDRSSSPTYPRSGATQLPMIIEHQHSHLSRHSRSSSPRSRAQTNHPTIIMAPSRRTSRSRSRSRSPSYYSRAPTQPIIITQPPQYSERDHGRRRSRDYSSRAGTQPPIIMTAPRPHSRSRSYSPGRSHVGPQEPIIIMQQPRSRSHSRSRYHGSHSHVTIQPPIIMTGPSRRSRSRSRSPRHYQSNVGTQLPIIMTAPSYRSRSHSPHHYQSNAGTRVPITMTDRPCSRSHSCSRHRDYSQSQAGTHASIVIARSGRHSRSRSRSPRHYPRSQQPIIIRERSRSRSPNRLRKHRAESPDRIVTAGPIIMTQPYQHSERERDRGRRRSRHNSPSQLETQLPIIMTAPYPHSRSRSRSYSPGRSRVGLQQPTIIVQQPRSRSHSRSRYQGSHSHASTQPPIIMTAPSRHSRSRSRSPRHYQSNVGTQPPIIMTAPSCRSPSRSPHHYQPNVGTPGLPANALERSVASIACAQAFDGSFDPSPELVLLLIGRQTLPNLPSAMQSLNTDESVKATMWCSMLVLIFLDFQFGDEKDTWVMFADKTQNWMEETLGESGLDRPGIDKTLQEVRDAGAQVFWSQ